jgi:hypothetical protein
MIIVAKRTTNCFTSNSQQTANFSSARRECFDYITIAKISEAAAAAAIAQKHQQPPERNERTQRSSRRAQRAHPTQQPMSAPNAATDEHNVRTQHSSRPSATSARNAAVDEHNELTQRSSR